MACLMMFITKWWLESCGFFYGVKKYEAFSNPQCSSIAPKFFIKCDFDDSNCPSQLEKNSGKCLPAEDLNSEHHILISRKYITTPPVLDGGRPEDSFLPCKIACFLHHVTNNMTNSFFNVCHLIGIQPNFRLYQGNPSKHYCYLRWLGFSRVVSYGQIWWQSTKCNLVRILVNFWAC